MSKKMAGVLIVYGIGMVCLGLGLQQVGPASGRVARIAGFGGGGLCLLLGIVALLGLKGRVWALLSTIALSFVVLTQTVQVWMPSAGAGLAGPTLRVLVSVMMVSTVGLLLYLVHGERTSEFYQTGMIHPSKPTSIRSEGESGDKGSRR